MRATCAPSRRASRVKVRLDDIGSGRRVRFSLTIHQRRLMVPGKPNSCRAGPGWDRGTSRDAKHHIQLHEHDSHIKILIVLNHSHPETDT